MAKKMLVCEDNEVNVVLLRDILAVDGYDAIRTIRENSATWRIPIVAITSFAMVGLRDPSTRRRLQPLAPAPL